MLLPMSNTLQFDTNTLRSRCTVSSMALFCSTSLINFLNESEMFQAAPFNIVTTFER